MTTGYDVAAVREQFPALGEGAAHFDGPGGSQTPASVADAVAGTLRSAIANRGTVTRAEQRSEGIVAGSRNAVAALLNADPAGIAFGPSMTALTYKIAYTLAPSWRPGDEIVLTRLDHDAHVRPWVQAAARAGATVRWADFDPATGELPAGAVTDLLTDRTRLVAVTAASNLLGTCPDIAAIAPAVHSVGGLFSVDGVHFTPHSPVDVTQLGADFYFCSAYKFFGPHLGILAADPQLLRTLHPDKLAPQTDAVPERFEWGTLPYEQLAGTTAAVEFLAGLAGSAGHLRDRIVASMGHIEAYESNLCADLESRLAEISGVRLFPRARQRTPTLLFLVGDRDPADIYRGLAARGINAPAGTFYAYECARRLGIAERGAVRVGLAPYTDASDIDRLISGIRELAAETV
ncbi:MAG TPA: cysteine desulfurase-like protein [Mycobacteriales bacterium]|nr:cysteine desulfurase-like protein [Mycobacteriales bacterium]